MGAERSHLCHLQAGDPGKLMAEFSPSLKAWEPDGGTAGVTPSSVQFSLSVMSNALWPHGPQHARLPCPPLSPRACSHSCPLSQWCYLTISSSAAPFSYLQSFPASGSFPMSQLFSSDGQNIGASAVASVLPMNIQGWFPSGLTGLISLQSKGLSRVFLTVLA